MNIGKLSESMLKRSILKEIKTKREEIISGAAVGNDCALFALSEGVVLATNMQEGCLYADNRHGSLENILIRCLNNLAVKGATPFAVLLTFMLPEWVEEAAVKQWMRQAEQVLGKYQVQIAGGQTTVSESCAQPMAVVTGYGKAEAGYRGRRITAGMEIVLSKWIGLEGTAILANTNEQRLLERYPAYFIEEAKQFTRYGSVLAEAATAVKSDVCAMHDASKGGIFAALWEIAEATGIGLKVDMKKIPLRQETVEICEELGVNPYKLLSGGCIIMITDKAEQLVSALNEQGVNAVSIGVTTDTKERVLLNEEEIRYLEKPDRDEIYTFYQKGLEA